MSKSRLLAIGLAVTGLAGAVALGYNAYSRSDALLPIAAESEPAAKAPVQVAEKQKTDGPSKEAAPGVRVEAPHTAVNVDKERGKVRVKAPHTDVRVDPDKGQVRVRAPYVDLDIRW